MAWKVYGRKIFPPAKTFLYIAYIFLFFQLKLKIKNGGFFKLGEIGE